AVARSSSRASAQVAVLLSGTIRQPASVFVLARRICMVLAVRSTSAIRRPLISHPRAVVLAATRAAQYATSQLGLLLAAFHRRFSSSGVSALPGPRLSSGNCR